MTPDRWAVFAAAFASAAADIEGGSPSMCAVACSLLAVPAASITIITDDHRSPVCVSGPGGRELIEAQLLVGEGPSLDAYASGDAVLVPDGGDVAERWPALAVVVDLQRNSTVLAVPLRVGAARFGVLTVCGWNGPLRPAQSADAWLVADVIVARLLGAQAQEKDDQMAALLTTAEIGWAQIHQASGMVSAQLSLSIVDALLRLRSYAFTANRPLLDVAEDVIARRLHIA